MRDLIDGTRPRNAAPSLEELRRRREEVIEICSRYGASNVRVFGSVARCEQDEESDVDFLVDLEPSRGLLDLAGLVDDLEQALGCPVDVSLSGSTRPEIAPRAEREAVAL